MALSTSDLTDLSEPVSQVTASTRRPVSAASSASSFRSMAAQCKSGLKGMQADVGATVRFQRASKRDFGNNVRLGPADASAHGR